jgi:1-acyl-sn-glycerol-3-phosphate acyltransferase
MRLLFRVRVENAHLLPQTPAVFVANHLHPIDPLLLLGELPAVPDCYTLGDSRSLYGKPWKRRLLRWTKGVIPLNRWWKEERAVIEGAKQGRPDCLALAADIQQTVPDGRSLEMLRQLDRAIRGILSSGSSLLLFPEGRLGNREGQLLPLKPGTATYALRSGCPVVPIAIIGTHDLFFRKCLTLRVGEPITVEPTPRPKSAQIRQLSDEIAARLNALLDGVVDESSDRPYFRRLLNRLFAG